MLAFLAPFFGGALNFAGGLVARLLAWLGTLNIWQIGCIALGIALGVDHAALIMAHRHSAKVEAHDQAVSAQLAAALADQANLKKQIAAQNAAVAALGAKTVAQQKQAQDALGRAAQRVAEAKASSERLAASARQRPPGGSCAPSKALTEQWQ